jgi:hypothetical protein
MKGKISKSVPGELSNVIKSGKRKCALTFFKKDISSKILRIKINIKKIKEIIRVFFRNKPIMYLSKVFIIL